MCREEYAWAQTDSLIWGRRNMKWRSVASAVVVASAVGMIAPGSGSVAGQRQNSTGGAAKWTVGRAAWGDPDLQGKWAVAETGTPMERSKEFANREFLTDKEMADRTAELTKSAPPADGDDPAFPELKKTAPAHEKGIRGQEYNRFWVDGGPRRITPWKRTSLVVDPPDGRILPLTPEAVKRLEAREAARRG